MKGYPEYFATMDDYENIMRDFPEWKERVKSDLKVLKAIKDDKVMRATELIDPKDPKSKWKTEEISNPFPQWKQKGFTTKKALSDLILSANTMVVKK
jgi:hypothetical protein